MKVLKVLLAIILILVIVVAVMGMLAPKDVSIDRSTTVDAPRAQVFDYLADFNTFNDWSPWTAMDPDQKVEISGEAGTVGSMYSWDGTETGKGNMTISGLEDGESISQKLEFTAPFVSSADVAYNLSDADGGGTEVHWTYEQKDLGFMDRLTMMLFVKSMLTTTYDQGLASLAGQSEKINSMAAEMSNMPMEIPAMPEGEAMGEFGGFAIIKAATPEMMMLGVRDKVQMTEMTKFFGESYGKVGAAMQEMGVGMTGMPCGVYYDWDEESGIADMAAAIPVDDKGGLLDRIIEGVKKIKVKEGTALMLDHLGPYESIEGAHEAMDACMKANNLEFDEVVIEQYLNDPMEVKPEEILTRVVYMVKDKE